MKIKVKKLHEDAIIPRFAHSTDTGFDLFTVEKAVIEPRQKGIVKTGLSMEFPKGWGMAIRNKSGITIKGVPNGGIDKTSDLTVYLGTIDNGYRGEIGIMVKNETDEKIIIPKHTKLAQGVLEKVTQCEFELVEELENSKRGTGGYGSTGVGIE